MDFAYDPPIENVMGLVFAEDQSGFLAGALAGLMTKSKVVGMVAGQGDPAGGKIPQGVPGRREVACVRTARFWVCISTVSRMRPGERPRPCPRWMRAADVIFGAGGLTGSGAILGAAQSGAWVIGVDQDEYLTTFNNGKAPGADRVLSSAMKRVDVAVYNAVKAAATGAFKGGVQVSDMAGGGLGLAPFHQTENSIPEEVKAALEEIADDLGTGKIKTGVGP